jgi:hypothetical protein
MGKRDPDVTTEPQSGTKELFVEGSIQFFG